MDKSITCKECKYHRVYDYGIRIHYCDSEDRTEEMGKIGVVDLPVASPEWCPLREA